MTRTRRVAIFTETFLPRVDGIVNTLKWTVRGLLETGWEPLVVAPAGNTHTLPGIRVIGSPSIVFPPYPEVRLAYPTPDVWRSLDAFGPDVVHLAGPVCNGFGGLKYAQARRLPVISTFHTALPAYAQLYGMSWIVDWAWAMLRDLHNSTAATLCPSSATIGELRQRGFQRLQLWARGVDRAQFTPDARSRVMRARLGASQDEVLILYVGRLAREKKLERLAAALQRLRGVHVALVGDGPDRARLEQLFEGLPVTFMGLLHGADLASAYASGDVFAFPSDTETFGNVVLEAMACGLPVVATSVGGQVDLVNHEVNGLLFAPDDVGRFAAHLERYRDDAGLRSRHGTAGLRVASDHTWQHQVEVLETHYCAAMNGALDGIVVAAA